jgi:hypothetical protein
MVSRWADDPPMTERIRLIIEIDEPMGPGVEFDANVDGIGSTARRARVRGPWLGLDRGHLVDTDDGSGRAVPALIALAASGDEARRIVAGLDGEILGWLASPRRPGQVQTEVMAVSGRSISVISGAGTTEEVSFDRMHGLEATFSTLRGRIATIGESTVAMTYPSTLGASAAPIIRLARRLLANS